MELKFTPKRIILIVIVVVAIIVILATAGNVVEINSAGDIQVKQAALSGDLTYKTDPGFYFQGFGKITTYSKTDTVYFSTDADDGGSGSEADAIKNVRFYDGGQAETISGVLVYRLPTDDKNLARVHEEIGSMESFRYRVKQHLTECIMNTASFMKADEVYGDRRAEFSTEAGNQLLSGIYATESEETIIKDEVNKTTSTEKIVRIKRNEDGKPIIAKASPLSGYGISIVQFTVKELNFDEVVEDMIKSRKDAEKAKQDAITATERGRAEVEKARAEELKEKVTAVTKAEKEKEVAILQTQKDYEVGVLKAEQALKVAELDRQTAEENAKAELVKQEANAKANALLVKAGLTPREKAEIEKETAIGVARELAKINFPELMVIGGGSNGQTINPFDAVGLEAFIDISKKMADGN